MHGMFKLIQDLDMPAVGKDKYQIQMMYRPDVWTSYATEWKFFMLFGGNGGSERVRFDCYSFFKEYVRSKV